MNEPKLRDLLLEVGVRVVHKNRRGWLVAKCPFAEYLHERGTDHNPSFFFKVNPEGYSGFNCYTCHQHGNITKFLTKLGSLRGEDYNSLTIRAMMDETPDSFQEWDASREHSDEDAELEPIEKDIYFRLYPDARKFSEARDYLRERGISLEAAEIANLRFDEDEGRILFPVMNHKGDLFGFSGRTILPPAQWPSKRYSKVKDYAGLKKERVILGENLIDPDKPMLVVEGGFAFLNMIDECVDEFCNPVGTLGSFMSEHQRDILVDYDQPVFMLYDGDAAGDQGLFGTVGADGYHEGGGAIDLLRKHVPVYRVKYPKHLKKKDPDFMTYEDVKNSVLGSFNEPF
jgi:DNA primase